MNDVLCIPIRSTNGQDNSGWVYWHSSAVISTWIKWVKAEASTTLHKTCTSMVCKKPQHRFFSIGVLDAAVHWRISSAKPSFKRKYHDAKRCVTLPPPVYQQEETPVRSSKFSTSLYFICRVRAQSTYLLRAHATSYLRKKYLYKTTIPIYAFAKKPEENQRYAVRSQPVIFRNRH